MKYNEFCRQTVQNEAPDLYVIAMMAKKPAQTAALWSVFAFAHEIVKTPYMVSEPTLGLIRLQWWRDELDKLYAGQPVAAGEILRALTDMRAVYDVQKAALTALIDACECEVRGAPPPTTPKDICTYIAAQHLPLLKIATLIEGDDEEASVLEAVAVNRGLIDVLVRAKTRSVVENHRAALIHHFETKLKPKTRIIKAFQNHSAICFKRLRTGQTPLIPPNMALRLWTSMLWK